MSGLVLYRAIASPPARSVMMLGDILRLPLECRDVNLLRGEHKGEEFKKMNPMGTVPVLKDGDFILSESHAILKYLLQQYGGEHCERLYPSEARARALVEQGLFFNSGYFFTRLSAIIMPTLKGESSGPTADQQRGVTEAYDVVEAWLRGRGRGQGRGYVAGAGLTVADLSVGATATAAQLIVPLDNDRYPHFADWLNRIGEEPCFKNINAEGVAILGKLLNKFWEKKKLEIKNRN